MKKICFEAELVDSFAHYPTVFAALMKTSGAMATDGIVVARCAFCRIIALPPFQES
jgi:hypothetical protein